MNCKAIFNYPGESVCFLPVLWIMKDFSPLVKVPGNVLHAFCIFFFFFLLQEISSDINQASQTLKKLSLIIEKYEKGLVSHPDVDIPDLEWVRRREVELSKLYQRWQTIFIWQDGPLVEAMKNGDLFLVDEISLADDSVLERLNSVLEPERKLVGLFFFPVLFVYLVKCVSWIAQPNTPI